MKEKEVLTVPKGIEFISQWNNFDITKLTFPHIMNKKITGCGFTEYFLRNPYNVILCSPRRMLLENKVSQHSDDIYYFRNDVNITADYEKGVDKADRAKLNATFILSSPSQSRRNKYLQKQKAIQEAIRINVDVMKLGLSDYINKCLISRKPCKILVTYDSFKYVREVLDNMISSFVVAVDEFQSIFVDSRYKADTELSFLKYLGGINRVCFLSATPMLEKYMNMVDEFKNIKYYELDWETEDPRRVTRPTLSYKFCSRSVLEEAYRVIEIYKKLGHDTEYLVSKDSLGNLQKIYSNEAVLFLNSVTSICTIIKSMKLKYEEVNVLCAKTEENEKKLRKAFGLTKRKLPEEPIGKIPKRDDPHKMFTFCTRTVYLGADFYSKCAKTFIFSDANYETLAVDILLDLDQILGRQRLDENPWRNRATIFIRTSDNLRDQDEFDAWIGKKKKMTNNLLNIYSRLLEDEKESLLDKFEQGIYAGKYKKDYVSINKLPNSELIPVFNNLILISELRAFEVQNIEYADQYVVKSSLNQGYFAQVYDPSVTELFKTLKDTFTNLSSFRDRMLFLRDVQQRESPEIFNSLLGSIPLNFKNYFTFLTPSEIASANYIECDLKRLIDSRIDNQGSTSTIANDLLSIFKVGEKYENSWIKEKLLGIYQKYDYRIGFKASIVSKAIDIEDWFDVEEVRYVDKTTKKRVRGYKILGVK